MDWAGQRVTRVRRLVDNVRRSNVEYEDAREELEEYEDDPDPPNDMLRARLEAFQRVETARYVLSSIHIHSGSLTNSGPEDGCKINNLREAKPRSVMAWTAR